MSDNVPLPSIPNPAALSQWQQLSDQLQLLRQGRIPDQSFCSIARAQKDLLGALPARYATVLADLLDRMESSALFTEESCSFSRKDLVEGLQVWVDKAHQQLAG